MIYLKKEGLLAVGTVRSNRLQGCPLLSNEDLQKSARGASDYRVDNNSGIIIVKWLDNSVVQLTSNYVGIEPMDQIERWDKTAGERKNVDCPQIVKAYNKSMGGVDLADMLIALYRISVKAKRCYIKIFWHLVDIAKVNGWILCKRHRVQLSIPHKEENTSWFLMRVSWKSNKSKQDCCQQFQKSTNKKEKWCCKERGEKAAVAIPCHYVRYDVMSKVLANDLGKNVIFICVSWKTEIVSSCSTHNPKWYLYQFCTTQTIRL